MEMVKRKDNMRKEEETKRGDEVRLRKRMDDRELNRERDGDGDWRGRKGGKGIRGDWGRMMRRETE